MLNKASILRTMTFIAKNFDKSNDLIIINQSALVLNDTARVCSTLDCAIANSKTYKELVNTFSDSVENINEEGEAVCSFHPIKGLIVNVTNKKVTNTETIDELKCISNTENIENLDKLGDKKSILKISNVINGTRTLDDDVEQLRALYRGVEDLTKIRIQSGQRVLACFKHKLGVTPSEDEEKIAKKLAIIEDNHKMLTDGVIKLTEASFKKRVKLLGPSKGVYIDNFSEMLLVTTYINLRKEEEAAIARLGTLLKDIPVWTEHLLHVKGCGVKSAAAIVSELNIDAARYPSSFWKYCGLDVTVDPDNGKDIGRRNWSRLMEEVEFIDTEGKVTKTKNLGYNARLKSKLVFIMASSMLKGGGYYRTEVYDPYKARLENRPDLKDVVDETGKVVKSNKGHRHNMAMRYMVKQFLTDLFINWKKMVGGEIIEPYGVAKLGMKKHSRRTFNECLELVKLHGGKVEDYVGSRDITHKAG